MEEHRRSVVVDSWQLYVYRLHAFATAEGLVLQLARERLSCGM